MLFMKLCVLTDHSNTKMLNKNLLSFSLQSGLINLQMRASFASLSFKNFIYFEAFIAFLNVAFHALGFCLCPVDKKMVQIFTIELFF